MMSAASLAARTQPLLVPDARKLLFSISSFLAAAATLAIVFSASLPRPWWALLTVYVTAQPMAGAFRPKVLYRIAGILTGATVTIAIVPNFQNSPELLILAMGGWTGFCIYLAVLDRTPRAFLFQMAAFSSAVMSFPYLDDPANIFSTTTSRVAEMVIAIVCVTAFHALLQPWSATPLIRGRGESFLRHASRWTIDALGTEHNALEQEHRRQLAADVTELGMIAVHLPFDQRGAAATGRTVLALQERLGAVLPFASAAANRLEVLRKLGPVDPSLVALIRDVSTWLEDADASIGEEAALLDRCQVLGAEFERGIRWEDLLATSVCERMANFIEAHQQSRDLVRAIDDRRAGGEGPSLGDVVPFPLARDHVISALAGLATAVAISLYCVAWVELSWTSGSATAAFAALITCSFAVQDDPAPVVGRYLTATLKTFPVAALYLFVILPRVDGYEMLIVTLAPALIWMGYIQADPKRSASALPMFSCFIVAMGFLDRFQADFASFLNTGIAQVGGIITTLVVTRMFRTANAAWTASRVVNENWIDLEHLADIRRPFRPAIWTGQATDRLGQIAARVATARPGDALHAADALADLRVGRNIIVIRRTLSIVPHDLRRILGDVLAGIAKLMRTRRRAGSAQVALPELLQAIDRAVNALLETSTITIRHDAVLALVGMRCNLFPGAPPLARGEGV